MSGSSRRDFLGGGIVVFFSLAWEGAAQSRISEAPPRSAPSPSAQPGNPTGDLLLDSWIELAGDGRATVFTGKVEFGQGIKTALIQIAADELDMDIKDIALITANTARTPNEGFTAGSHSVSDSGSAIANAAANVRFRLMEVAGKRWNVPIERLSTKHGKVRANGGLVAEYGQLAEGLNLQIAAVPGLARRAASERRFIGRSVSRADIPAKLFGTPSYVHDLTMPGMLHARVLRGPSHGTILENPAIEDLRKLGAGVEVVQRKGFAALIGAREWPVVKAHRALSARTGQSKRSTESPGGLGDAIQAAPSKKTIILERRDPLAGPAALTMKARYTRPYLLHGSIGPSCAIALFDDDALTVWTHSQGVFALRGALASLTGLPLAKVTCIHVEGAGCYGHNGADDVAADAAIIALLRPSRPIRVLWSREQEHGWEPLGPAMLTELSASLGSNGQIVEWRHEVWSESHSTRPRAGGDFLASREIGSEVPSTPPFEIPQPEGGGDRNLVPLYRVPNVVLTSHFIPETPVRVSALRSLGAHLNVFSIECFMDELALMAGRDPIAFRLAHLDDSRAKSVVEDAASSFRVFDRSRRPFHGAGFAFARYKNLGAYCAVAVEVEVNPHTLEVIVNRVVATVDCGQAVNPDGVRNQIEGGIVQSLSWTSREAVPFDDGRRTASNWANYPIARFDTTPRSLEVRVLDRPNSEFLGVGEAAQGPAAAAYGNALSKALGRRLRDMPLIPTHLDPANDATTVPHQKPGSCGSWLSNVNISPGGPDVS